MAEKVINTTYEVDFSPNGGGTTTIFRFNTKQEMKNFLGKFYAVSGTNWINIKLYKVDISYTDTTYYLATTKTLLTADDL